MEKNVKSRSEVSLQERKNELAKQRQAELQEYHQELIDFCRERNIELSATVTVGSNGNEVRISMVDKL